MENTHMDTEHITTAHDHPMTGHDHPMTGPAHAMDAHEYPMTAPAHSMDAHPMPALAHPMDAPVHSMDAHAHPMTTHAHVMNANGHDGEIHPAHGHYHSPEEKKKQLNRISRAIGHLQHVKTMMENDEDCADVLIQLSAVEAALHNLGKEVINEHMTHCIVHAIEDGNMEAVEEFQKAIKKFL